MEQISSCPDGNSLHLTQRESGTIACLSHVSGERFEKCLLTISKSRFAIVANRDLMDWSCPEHGRDQDATS